MKGRIKVRIIFSAVPRLVLPPVTVTWIKVRLMVRIRVRIKVRVRVRIKVIVALSSPRRIVKIKV